MAKKATQLDPAAMTFEKAIEELEALTEKIEEGEIGLQEALAQRKRGELLIKRCRAVLDQAEQEIEQIAIDQADEDDPA